jgi:16S rRNA (guanine1207-N2)-methyltransferase
MTDDPALALLAGSPPGEGERVLLLGCAGAPTLAGNYAVRYGETFCHEDSQPAAARLAADGRLHVLLGDLPCCSARPEGAEEDFLPAHRFPEAHFDRIVLRLGRGTAQVNASLREAFRMLRPGGELLAAAANQEGAKSFAKRAEGHFGEGELVALKHSCRLFRFRKRAPAPAEPVEDPGYYRSLTHTLAHAGGETRYRTKPGVFAYRGTDAGTALLGSLLPDCSGKRVLDLCCGSGPLALAAFARGASEVMAVDASATAIACAERNFSEAGLAGKAICAGFDAEIPGGFDVVLANPPFHDGSATDYSLPARVSEAIAAALSPGGEAWLVANQFLDYARPAQPLFAQVATAARAAGYLIHHMVKGA